ncbi:hypothetical protein JTE90_027369 [Oedothorax gibbosus]|uniref:Uncharacterized protein n=1 Tax=Oedothorax gibbosus TaxID=931172 RepID=A0AAV6W2N5_9ARAC|nr:hypothetical protein JTE90_027369 [Oedothorax gibbosus]
MQFFVSSLFTTPEAHYFLGRNFFLMDLLKVALYQQQIDNYFVIKNPNITSSDATTLCQKGKKRLADRRLTCDWNNRNEIWRKRLGRGLFLREKSSSRNCARKENVPFSLKRNEENGRSHSYVGLGSFGSDSMVLNLSLLSSRIQFAKAAIKRTESRIGLRISLTFKSSDQKLS